MSRLLTLHDPSTARRYHGDGLWHDETFYALLARHADSRPDARAVRDSARWLTWAELRSWVDAVADAFHAAVVRPGERVAVWASNRVEVIACFLACSRNGYVCNPSLHRNYTVEEITALLTRVGATAAVVETGWGADTDRHDPVAALQDLPAMRRVFVLPPERTAGDLPPLGTAPAGLAPVDPNPDSVCYLAFTSGTTGMPKGVMHSDNSLLANCRDLVRDWHHDTDTVLLTLSPLSHHIAWVAVGQWLVAGMQLVIDDAEPGLSRLDWIVETGATYVMGVPTHAMDIQAEQARRGMDRLGSVSLFYMAGAPIPPAVAERFVAQGVKPQNIYGMTENSSHQYTHPGDDEATICATCGRGGRAYEVRIFDQDNADLEVPVGTVGQIGGRGAALMLGYFDNQHATETSFNRDGWFLSGDLGVLDGDGNLSIVGRLKDVVIRGGHNIFPARVEDLAVKHPAIDKAAAFPVADERLGEKLALAVLADGAPPDADGVLSHLFAAGLSKYDMPEYFLVMDAFPLTPSGKILKRELADWAKSGRITPQPCRFRAPETAEGSPQS